METESKWKQYDENYWWMPDEAWLVYAVRHPGGIFLKSTGETDYFWHIYVGGRYQLNHVDLDQAKRKAEEYLDGLTGEPCAKPNFVHLEMVEQEEDSKTK
jgi:hypothetical protein